MTDAMTDRGYTQADLDDVSDNPEWTAEDFANARPFTEAFPYFAKSIKRARGEQKAPVKVSTTIRLSREVIDHFRQGGPGWQTRIDHALREWIARPKVG